MSATVVIEQLQNKRAQLENEWASLDQKMQAMKEDIRKLEEQLTARLEEKVRVKRAAFERMESAKRDLENQLAELREDQELSPSSDKPISVVKENKEEVPCGHPLCQHCGCENILGAVFCERCGKKIEQA